MYTNQVHGGIELTETSGNVLFHGKQVHMPMKKPPEAAIESSKKTDFSTTGSEVELFEALKALRFRLAQQEGVPAHIMFSNANLADMTKKSPKTISEFMDVSGVGEVKNLRYGKTFLEVIAGFRGGKSSG